MTRSERPREEPVANFRIDIVSTLLAVLSGNDARSTPPSAALRATLRSTSGEAARIGAWTSDDQRAGLAVAREDWECQPWLAGDADVVSLGHVSVVADASLYSRHALAAELVRAGHPVVDDSPTALIAAVYLSRGPAGVIALNGDFAFVLWDAQRQTMLLGRDFVGSRTLYYTIDKGRLIAASTLSGVLTALGGTRAQLRSSRARRSGIGPLSHPSGRTCYSGVWAVPAGQRAERGPIARADVVARWSAPTFETGSSTIVHRRSPRAPRAAQARGRGPNGARPLHDLDERRLRLDRRVRDGALGAGERDAGTGRDAVGQLPVGDQGREDDIIEMVLKHHGVQGRFIDSAELPLLGEIARNAAKRDQPFAALYDGFFRRASRGSRDVGARVALSGHGGDILFDAPLVYFADLISGFHARTLPGRVEEIA